MNAAKDKTAFVNQNNFKNATTFFMKAGSAKAALNKEYYFLLFALVNDANLHNEKLSQSGELTRGIIRHRPEYLKFFILVFLMIRKCCK